MILMWRIPLLEPQKVSHIGKITHEMILMNSAYYFITYGLCTIFI